MGASLLQSFNKLDYKLQIPVIEETLLDFFFKLY